MQVTIDYLADTALVAVSGRVDHSSAAMLESEFEKLQKDFFNSTGKHLVVDLTDVEFISTAGLRVLLIAAKAMKAQSGSMAIANPNKIVQEVLSISRFDMLLPIHGAVQESLQEISHDAAELYDRNHAIEEKSLQIKFWGTRGSIPVSHNSVDLRQKLQAALGAANGRKFNNSEEIERFIDEELPFTVSHTWGGNTSCVQIADNGRTDYFICDIGSGARELAGHIMRTRDKGQPVVCHILLSHLHWDHIMGFPFFTPVYIPGDEIHLYGCHRELEQAFRTQNSGPNFPVSFDALSADIHFHQLTPGESALIANRKVTPFHQNHGDDSYGYRIETNGKVVVYSTDSEHKEDNPESMQPVMDFFRQADLVIFDAMYSLADAITCKQDWGHSSNIVGVDLCHLAEAKRLCLFHHEPINNDETNYQIYKETIRYEELSRQGHDMKVISAYDGLVLDL